MRSFKLEVETGRSEAEAVDVRRRRQHPLTHGLPTL